MEEEYITVSQITQYIAGVIARDSNLKHVFIKGELSNVKLYRRGMMFFTLKDDKSQIRCVMFGTKFKLKFEPKDGMKVLVEGKIQVYAKNGYYQLFADKITEEGIGDLHRRYEELKVKLNKEGLFDKSHKKEIPDFPDRIGVITASNGAAIRDIISTIKRRWPLCEVMLFPSLVQGEKAAESIANQIKRSEKYELDTLIVGRGGGSIEDLWSFNEEIVARAIYECNTPVISAVGHEIDYTITDFVADLRAPTPTAAAEIAVPNYDEIKADLNQFNSRANLSIKKTLNENKYRLKNIASKRVFKNPFEIYASKEMMLANSLYRLEKTANSIINSNKSRLDLVKNSGVFKNPEVVILNQKDNYLDNLVYRMKNASNNILNKNRSELFLIKNSNVFKNPKKVIIKEKEADYDKLVYRLDNVSNMIVNKNKSKLDLVKNSNVFKSPDSIINKQKEDYLLQISKLDVLNPLNTLKRGYTLAKSNGKVISSSKQVKSGDELEVEFEDGNVNTRVI